MPLAHTLILSFGQVQVLKETSKSFLGKFFSIHYNNHLIIYSFALYLGPQVCDALLIAHALSGCDCLYYMYGIVKPNMAKAVLNHHHLIVGILEQDSRM